MEGLMYAHHYDSSAHVLAEPETLFLYLDDQERLSAHMMQSSAMTAGMKMRFDFDAQRGREVGSKIRLSGKFFGLSLGLVEVVTKREPPLRKIWETVGEPHMLVIGSFRMGFEIEPEDGGSRLTVFMDYNEPSRPWQIVGRLLGGLCARWCTRRMANGAATHFIGR